MMLPELGSAIRRQKYCTRAAIASLVVSLLDAVKIEASLRILQSLNRVGENDAAAAGAGA
jgi:hypothetical protein